MCAACLAASSSWADDAGDEAKREFQRGMAALEAGHNEAALAAFLKSRELKSTRASTQNAALTLKRLGRYDEALELLTAMPKEFPNMTPAQLEAVRTEIEELERSTGLVEVESEESGATVVVAGRARGQVPLSGPVRLNPGRHLLRLERDGTVVASVPVQVVAGARAVARPVRQPARVELEPAPKRAPPPPLRSARASRHPASPTVWRRLRVGFELGAVAPAGNVDPDTPLGDAAPWGIAVAVGAGYSPARWLEVGGRASAGELQPGTDCERGPAGTTIRCSGDLVLLGVVATYRMTDPSSSLIPYLGLGLDYDMLTVERDVEWWPTGQTEDQGYSRSSFSPSAEVGLDLALSRALLLGPHLSVSVGSYHEEARHFWIGAGVRLSLRTWEH